MSAKWRGERISEPEFDIYGELIKGESHVAKEAVAANPKESTRHAIEVRYDQGIQNGTMTVDLKSPWYVDYNSGYGGYVVYCRRCGRLDSDYGSAGPPDECPHCGAP